MYEQLTKYAGTLADRELDCELGGGTIGMDDFIQDFYGLEGFVDKDYFETIERYGVDTSDGIEGCDVEHADLDLLRACITWCVRGDRFYDGCLAIRAENGFLDRCLARIKELDEGLPEG